MAMSKESLRQEGWQQKMLWSHNPSWAKQKHARSVPKDYICIQNTTILCDSGEKKWYAFPAYQQSNGNISQYYDTGRMLF